MPSSIPYPRTAEADRWTTWRSVAALTLVVALTTIGCGSSDPEAEPKGSEAEPPTTSNHRGAGSGTARDDDCIQLTRGETAEIVVLDNVFAPECPVVVSDQILRLRNLGIRNHTFTISENQDDLPPFVLDLTIEGEKILETRAPFSQFLGPGLYEFFCKFHLGMDGVMQVVEPVGTLQPSPPAESPEESAQDCIDFTAEPAVLITMVDNRFDPACFTVSRDQRLTIRNEGVSLHNLSVDFRKALTGNDLDVDVSSGKEKKTDPVGETLEPGNVKVFCKYHLPTMTAELEVV
jgi:plastocyanin